LDGKLIKNRQIKVRFAVHGATIKVPIPTYILFQEKYFLGQRVVTGGFQ
jgi:hypothetical protein